MSEYEAQFFRYVPNIADGGFVTTRRIVAKSHAEAVGKARKMEHRSTARPMRYLKTKRV